jgi:uncharacterized protein YdaU (DUF1376 family)
MKCYPFHIDQHLIATRHLTLEEEGAYLRLKNLYYARHCALPPDMVAIARLVRAQGKRERRIVESIIREFFTLSDSGWHLQRCDDELAAQPHGCE